MIEASTGAILRPKFGQAPRLAATLQLDPIGRLPKEDIATEHDEEEDNSAQEKEATVRNSSQTRILVMSVGKGCGEEDRSQQGTNPPMDTLRVRHLLAKSSREKNDQTRVLEG